MTKTLLFLFLGGEKECVNVCVCVCEVGAGMKIIILSLLNKKENERFP